MTTEQQVKEIVKQLLQDWSIAGEFDKLEEREFSKNFDQWASTPAAQSLLSGLNGKEDVVFEKLNKEIDRLDSIERDQYDEGKLIAYQYVWSWLQTSASS